ncbi:fimbrial biogenesis chaperone [Acinetobacter johnsonii]|uniref:fimbrial biogenesis chaperone n=1 Tax=Acinetobacter johnsonii TaxID=40214 RepID=UPI002169AFA1|nr:molecular chaperone [Acinetobacter johnsonii]MCS3527818.1 P pilus assembly chaperone PapD [Acinetobacter johnsonii]
MKVLWFVLGLFITSVTHSGLATSASRIIFEDDEAEKSFILVNINDYPIIVQTWVDEGEANPHYPNAPVVITPPVFKMEPDQKKSIRLFIKSNDLLKDRESVYWMNLLEIPGKPKSEANDFAPNRAYLDLAMNTQLKIFYRPKNLKKMGLDEIISRMNFSIERKNGKTYLVCKNLSPYNISFSKLKIITATEEILIEQMMDMMTKSFSKKLYPLPMNTALNNPTRVEFDVIDDSGRLNFNSVEIKN